MTSFFNSNFFKQNRKKLQETLGNDTPIIITANGSMQRAADEPFKFVQDSNFWYLTGLNTADLVLVLTKQESYLIAPVLTLERQVFDGAYDIDELKTRSGITEIVDERTGWRRIKQLLQQTHTVATLQASPSYLPRHRLHTLPYRRRLIAKLKRLQPGVTIRDIRMELARMRSVKQPAEVQALQHAIDITTATLQAATKPATLQLAQHEYELEAAISHGFRSRGAEGHAFEPIVGAGAHGTTLHHINNEGPIRDNDMIVLDVGACVEHYAADITRTVCKQPLSGRQSDVFQAVIAVQDYALSLLKPGVILHEYEAAVAKYMGTQLQQLGLISTNTPDQVHRYFPHATSHFLGLDTHDAGDYSQPLATNMIITCEPGIYIPEEGLGVRIEDDVLITNTGCKVLSSACPRLLGLVQ